MASDVPPAPGNGRRMTGEQRRVAIIEAAIREFSSRGYQGTTVAAIAARACCSEPMLYKHFADKRALLKASLEHVEVEVEAQIDAIVAGPAPVAQWLAFVEEPGYRSLLQLRMLCSTLPDDVELVEHLRGGTDRLLQRFRTAIERGQREGTIAPDVDPDAIGWTWLGLALAAVQAVAIDGPERYREVMDVARSYLLRALRPPQP